MSDRLKVFIAGSGGIGSAAGLILREMGDRPVDVYLGDIREEAAKKAADWITSDSKVEGEVRGVAMSPDGGPEEHADLLKDCHILLDCLPGSQAPRMARWALAHGMHYANLTEYVAETNEIMELAKGADTAFLLQTGLAPGFINVLANGLIQNFTKEHGTDTFESVNMKVGALSENAFPPHYYAFTWSSIGVSTEYLKPSIVVRDFKKTTRPALSGRNRLIIKGQEYEEALTSGGAADLPDAFEGKVRNLDYKTLRHVGHYGWVEDLLKELPEGEERPKALQQAMEDVIPYAEEDEVIVYASVEGKDKRGTLRMMEKAYRVQPMDVGGKRLRAIQTTTAGALAEAALMLARSDYKGTVLQSQLDPWPFIEGPIVSAIYRAYIDE